MRPGTNMKPHVDELRDRLAIPEQVSDVKILTFAHNVREAALEIGNERELVLGVAAGHNLTQPAAGDELSRRETYLARLDDILRDAPLDLADAIRAAARRDHDRHDELVNELARLDEKRKRVVDELERKAPVVSRPTLDALHRLAGGGLERRRQQLVTGGQRPTDKAVVPDDVLAKWRDAAEVALGARDEPPTAAVWDAEAAALARGTTT